MRIELIKKSILIKQFFYELFQRKSQIYKYEIGEALYSQLVQGAQKNCAVQAKGHTLGFQRAGRAG